MNTRGSDNTGEIRELLNRHLSGETSDEERERIREILASDPEAAQEFGRMEGARGLLRRAVSAEPIPDTLHAAVRRSTVETEGTGSGGEEDEEAGAEIDFGVATIITPPHMRDRGAYRYYAAAAVLLLLVAGWFVLRQSGGEDGPSGSEGVAGSVESPSGGKGVDPVRDILRIGMDDHVHCAVAFHKGELHESGIEEMEKGLGKEFAGLIPVVREHITEGRLLTAHRCAVGGREFVHMIVRGDAMLISVAVTRKEGGERLTGHDGAAAVSAAVPVYRAAMDGFQVAGFESGPYLVFVASDLSEQANLQVALNVAAPVSGVLGEGTQL